MISWHWGRSANRKKGLDRLVTAGILAVVFVILAGYTLAPSSYAGESVVKKVERSYDVAVVFDNSGSMYREDAWCKAKYAMEVFAAMMPYGKNDSLRIYPMWEVSTDGSKNGSFEPISIKNPDDIEKIHNMYTIKNGQTPFAPAREAYKDLQGSSADEKWLIVLTDGEFNMDARKGKEGVDVDVNKELSKMSGNGIKVQYLAMGDDAVVLQGDESKGLYAAKASDATLSQELIDICNRIYHRALLPSEDYADNGKITLDLSMNKLIVFAQGKGVKISDLKGPSGDVAMESERQCQYSDISTGGKYSKTAKVDKTLSGEVVTFAGCEKGIYKLSTDNVEKKNLQIFYEPNVNIKVLLKDPKNNNDEGTVLTDADSFKTGEYTIDYALVDNVTGKDVSDSSLLGKVTYDGKLVDSKGNEKDLKPGDPFTLRPDGDTFVKVKATYLEDYVISTEDMKDQYTIKVDKAAAKKMKMKLDVQQKGSWYNVKKSDEWKPIRANLTYNNKPLSDEQLKQVKLDCKFKDGKKMNYTVKPVYGESAIDIYPGQTKDGKYVEPELGKYEMTADASYTAKYSKASKATEKTKFRVEALDKLLWWLIRIIPCLLLLLLVLWWNLRKAFPKKVYFNDKMGATRIKIKNKGINLSTSAYPGELTCDAEKVTNHLTKKKKSAKFAIKNIQPDSSIQSFSIGIGTSFEKDGSGNFVDAFGETLTPKKTITVSNGAELIWKKAGKKERKGTITINNKKQ